MNRGVHITAKLEALQRSTFRSRFRLSPADQAAVGDKGLEVMRRHAAELLGKRLFPAWPPNDGKQTPMRGYPVFVAQHATATCCRSCLQKWHGIPKGRELTPPQQAYVLDVIEAWMAAQVGK